MHTKTKLSLESWDDRSCNIGYARLAMPNFTCFVFSTSPKLECTQRMYTVLPYPLCWVFIFVDVFMLNRKEKFSSLWTSSCRYQIHLPPVITLTASCRSGFLPASIVHVSDFLFHFSIWLTNTLSCWHYNLWLFFFLKSKWCMSIKFCLNVILWPNKHLSCFVLCKPVKLVSEVW